MTHTILCTALLLSFASASLNANPSLIKDVHAIVQARVSAAHTIASKLTATLRSREKEANAQRQAECNQAKQVEQNAVAARKKEKQSACNKAKKELQTACALQKKELQSTCNDKKKKLQHSCSEEKKKMQDACNEKKKHLQAACASDKAERRERTQAVLRALAGIKKRCANKKIHLNERVPLVKEYLDILKDHAKAADMASLVDQIKREEQLLDAQKKQLTLAGKAEKQAAVSSFGPVANLF